MAEVRVALGVVVERFAVKVAPLPTVPPEPTKPKPLSDATARHLRATATVLQDPELAALLRQPVQPSRAAATVPVRRLAPAAT